MLSRTSPRHARTTRRRSPLVRRIIVGIVATLLIFVGDTSLSLYRALHNPANGVSWMARFAEWGRTEGIGGIVTWAENEYNKLHPAKVGGVPDANAFGGGTTHAVSGPLPTPPRVISPALHPYPGEGIWRPVGRVSAQGVPAVYETFVRPDSLHTSYVVGMAWMDTRLLKAQLYSGSQIPGRMGEPYKFTAPITPLASKSLVAAFNSGFRMQDANGGYYTGGKVLKALRVGAASIVVYNNGNITVGQWGRDFHSLVGVASVRQNLDLIVDHGLPAAGLDQQNNAKWGAVTGNTYNVWRSGLGVTKDGALVYVGGPALSIADLANLLVRAGAVEGMEADMNTDWVVYATYGNRVGFPVGAANGTDLLNRVNAGSNAMLESSAVFFDTWWARDFYTMSYRAPYATP